MEKQIRNKQQCLKKALKTLEQSINSLEHVKSNIKQLEQQFNMYEADVLKTYRDSIIQRFEYSFDLFWKFLKLYLEYQGTTDFQINSPKGTFRVSLKTKIIDLKEAELAQEMVSDRNITTHIYREEIAQNIAVEIPKYYEFMIKIVNQIDV
jgi:nucleotidyltransferase substrate binding protein (TIGR01987 family)